MPIYEIRFYTCQRGIEPDRYSTSKQRFLHRAKTKRQLLFCKKSGNARQNVVSESGEIVKGYENSRLSRDLILAALSELERIGKERKIADEGAKI